jgi:hypothetical protein
VTKKKAAGKAKSNGGLEGGGTEEGGRAGGNRIRGVATLRCRGRKRAVGCECDAGACGARRCPAGLRWRVCLGDATRRGGWDGADETSQPPGRDPAESGGRETGGSRISALLVCQPRLLLLFLSETQDASPGPRRGRRGRCGLISNSNHDDGDQ